MTATIAAYVRVSSKRGQKTDSQVAEIKRWLEGQGIAPEAVEWYADTESGKTLDRPAFKRLQADIFSGKIRHVIVWKIDRLSRRLRDGVALISEWAEKGIKLTIITQGLEISGAVGRMVASLLLGLAEIELEYRRERQAAGIDVAKRRGKYRGRKAGTTKATPSRARELRTKGLTLDEIGTTLGVSRASVCRYLTAAK